MNNNHSKQYTFVDPITLQSQQTCRRRCRFLRRLIEQDAGSEILKEHRFLKGFMEFYEGDMRLFEGRIEK